MHRKLVLLFVLVTLAGLAACAADGAGADLRAGEEPVLALAASDLQVALPEIRDRYRADTGRRVELVFGSTGNLTTQIEHGAPGDLFFAANERFLDRLIGRGHVHAESRAIYGVGRIVLIAAPGVPLPRTLEELAAPAYHTVAIANPEHAPYGTAAREALEAAGVWEPLRPRLVFGENIAQALQFVRTGNADVGIVALGLVLGPSPEEHVLIEERLHAPLRQAAGVLAESRQPGEAAAFLEYVMGPVGQEILRRYGFAPPAGP